jgi:hypothetical protein
MKPLSDLNVQFNDVKKATKALNDAGVLGVNLKIPGVKGPEMLENFIVAMNGITTEQLTGLPEDIRIFYDALPDEAFQQIPEDAELTTGSIDELPPGVDEDADLQAQGSVTSECPNFKTKHTPEEADCRMCLQDFPEEFAACAAAAAAVKVSTAPANRKASTAGSRFRTRYGHAVGSMSGDIDDMLFVGMPLVDMAKKIAKTHDRTIEKAQSKVRAHIVHLTKDLKLPVTDVNGYLSCSTEYTTGFSAENTQLSYKGKGIAAPAQEPAQPTRQPTASEEGTQPSI